MFVLIFLTKFFQKHPERDHKTTKEEILDFLEKSEIGITNYKLIKDRIRFNFNKYKSSA